MNDPMDDIDTPFHMQGGHPALCTAVLISQAWIGTSLLLGLGAK